MKSFELVLGVAAAGLLYASFSDQAYAASPYWLRDAQVSPDGASIAFTYRGQIWIVPSDGGDASALTERQFRSTAPVWSPDSRRIAFASDRFNVSDVFVMSVDGGEITRLTHHSAPETPFAFSANGEEVFFGAARQGTPEADYLDGLGQSVGVLMKVPVSGGRARMVLPVPMAQADLSPDRAHAGLCRAQDRRELLAQGRVVGQHARHLALRFRDRRPRKTDKLSRCRPQPGLRAGWTEPLLDHRDAPGGHR